MKSRAIEFLLAGALIALGLALGYGGTYFGHIDDSPGLGLLGILLMLGCIALGIRKAWRSGRAANANPLSSHSAHHRRATHD